MGRPPCSDKVGVKKGPWSPEEDIMLVAYVQENGPANWRAVPANTGLRRCSKSCRLRWTNYLRPGIKRGTFTDHEEKMIIQLQALLGNKWAAIASYLPERTDNDIKNYWNTHLKKQLKKLSSTDEISSSNRNLHSISRGQWERRLQTDIHTAKQALHDALSINEENCCSSSEFFTNSNSNTDDATPIYASSAENIARLLKEWVKNTPKYEESKCSNSSNTCNNVGVESSCSGEVLAEGKTGVDLSEPFESLFGFEYQSSSNSDHFSRSTSPSLVRVETKPDPNGLGPLSVLEEWLLDDQGKDYLEKFSFDDGNRKLFEI
ncbi:hypothetical protein C2S53_019267 [Perilla frutescens var. hirtella]|uniref:Uncharacterized protein n=1 Tax=Perilla frutescens var. hirtella TaxID=608512 RepID=A0AAD4IZA1_PERFH|nr:hypothetical protein C2S53_019267 [Perilla frutescens var. hirtella]